MRGEGTHRFRMAGGVRSSAHMRKRCQPRSPPATAVQDAGARFVRIKTAGPLQDFLKPAKRLSENVASAILADVEPGILPGGKGVSRAGDLDYLNHSSHSHPNPGGKMPPSTAGETPAATFQTGSKPDPALAVAIKVERGAGS